MLEDQQVCDLCSSRMEKKVVGVSTLNSQFDFDSAFKAPANKYKRFYGCTKCTFAKRPKRIVVVTTKVE